LPIKAAVVAVGVAPALVVSSVALQRGLGGGGKETTTTTGTPSALAALRADQLDQHLFAMLRRPEPQGSHQVGRIIFA
jgi:hypothetical protein